MHIWPNISFTAKRKRKYKRGDLFFQISYNNRMLKKNRETVTNMIEEMKRASLMKQLVVAECKACEKNFNCYSSNEADNKEMFEEHIHLDQYKKHLESYVEFEEQQPLDTSDDHHTDDKYVL